MRGEVADSRSNQNKKKDTIGKRTHTGTHERMYATLLLVATLPYRTFSYLSVFNLILADTLRCVILRCSMMSETLRCVILRCSMSYDV